MRGLSAACLVLMLAGCTSAPPAPTTDLFSGLQAPDLALPEPVHMPARPNARQETVNGETLMCFGSAEAVQLRERDSAGSANTEILEHSRHAFDALTRSHAMLLEQAQHMERIANLRAAQYADAEARRLEDRREHRIETWMHRLLTIVLAGVAL